MSGQTRKPESPGHKAGWRNWGDHPAVVLLSVLASIIAIVTFLLGKDGVFSSLNKSNHLASNASPAVNISPMNQQTATPSQIPTIVSSSKSQNKSRPDSQPRAVQLFTEGLGEGVGLEMIEITGGTYTMGAPNENGENDEHPPHYVNIKSFYIGKNEITQAQWKAVFGNNDNPSYWQGDALPVENISWVMAKKFITKLNAKVEGRSYRLPTEAEWEYAARAGSIGIYYFDRGEELLNEYAWFRNNSGSKTNIVDQKKPNNWGLHDMTGNVWEWCEDVYHDSYTDAPQNGEAWLIGGNQNRRVARGGSWGNYPYNCRTTMRNRGFPDGRNNSIGFRVVMTR